MTTPYLTHFSLIFLEGEALLPWLSWNPGILSVATLPSGSPLLLVFPVASLSSGSPLLFVFPVATLPSGSPLLFVFPVATLSSGSPLLFGFPVASLSSGSPLLSVFPVASLSSGSPLLSVYPVATLSSGSPLLYVFPVATLSSGSPLLFVFPVATLSSGSPLLSVSLLLPYLLVIPRRSRRDIVLASSVRTSIPWVLTFYPSRTISQYLMVRFNSFLVQVISTMDSRYPVSFVKIGPLTLELLSLF